MTLVTFFRPEVAFCETQKLVSSTTELGPIKDVTTLTLTLSNTTSKDMKQPIRDRGEFVLAGWFGFYVGGFFGFVFVSF